MRPERQAGFTLLELLIAMTLLGLLMAGLLGGLRLGARAWDVGAARLEDSARLLVVHGFLAARLGDAMPIYAIDQEGRDALAFAGQADRVTLVTTLPDQLGPGLHTVTIGLSADDEAGRLVMAWRPFRLDEDGVPVEVAGGGRRVLLRGVEELELGYFGATGAEDEATWHEVWQEADLLPTLIRLDVGFARGDRRTFPPLVVRPMVDYVGLF